MESLYEIIYYCSILHLKLEILFNKLASNFVILHQDKRIYKIEINFIINIHYYLLLP